MVAVCTVASACSPALDWRTARVDGGAVELLFPCRPAHDARRVRLGGIETSMRMESCHAAGSTFSLAVAESADAAGVAPLIRALRTASIANLGGAASALPFAVRGATPNPLSGRMHIDGHLPDGRAAGEDAAFFVRGVHVYQASVLGEKIQPEAADMFLTSLNAMP